MELPQSPFLQMLREIRGEGDTIRSCGFSGEALENLDLESMDFENVIWEGCRFDQCGFAHSGFYQTKFVNCLFIGCHFRNRQYEMTPSLVKRGFTCHT